MADITIQLPKLENKNNKLSYLNENQKYKISFSNDENGNLKNFENLELKAVDDNGYEIEGQKYTVKEFLKPLMDEENEVEKLISNEEKALGETKENKKNQQQTDDESSQKTEINLNVLQSPEAPLLLELNDEAYKKRKELIEKSKAIYENLVFPQEQYINLKAQQNFTDEKIDKAIKELKLNKDNLTEGDIDKISNKINENLPEEKLVSNREEIKSVYPYNTHLTSYKPFIEDFIKDRVTNYINSIVKNRPMNKNQEEHQQFTDQQIQNSLNDTVIHNIQEGSGQQNQQNNQEIQKTQNQANKENDQKQTNEHRDKIKIKKFISTTKSVPTESDKVLEKSDIKSSMLEHLNSSFNNTTTFKFGNKTVSLSFSNDEITPNGKFEDLKLVIKDKNGKEDNTKTVGDLLEEIRNEEKNILFEKLTVIVLRGLGHDQYSLTEDKLKEINFANIAEKYFTKNGKSLEFADILNKLENFSNFNAKYNAYLVQKDEIEKTYNKNIEKYKKARDVYSAEIKRLESDKERATENLNRVSNKDLKSYIENLKTNLSKISKDLEHAQQQEKFYNDEIQKEEDAKAKALKKIESDKLELDNAHYDNIETELALENIVNYQIDFIKKEIETQENIDKNKILTNYKEQIKTICSFRNNESLIKQYNNTEKYKNLESKRKNLFEALIPLQKAYIQQQEIGKIINEDSLSEIIKQSKDLNNIEILDKIKENFKEKLESQLPKNSPASAPHLITFTDSELFDLESFLYPEETPLNLLYTNLKSDMINKVDSVIGDVKKVQEQANENNFQIPMPLPENNEYPIPLPLGYKNNKQNFTIPQPLPQQDDDKNGDIEIAEGKDNKNLKIDSKKLEEIKKELENISLKQPDKEKNTLDSLANKFDEIVLKNVFSNENNSSKELLKDLNFKKLALEHFKNSDGSPMTELEISNRLVEFIALEPQINKIKNLVEVDLDDLKEILKSQKDLNEKVELVGRYSETEKSIKNIIEEQVEKLNKKAEEKNLEVNIYIDNSINDKTYNDYKKEISNIFAEDQNMVLDSKASSKHKNQAQTDERSTEQQNQNSLTDTVVQNKENSVTVSKDNVQQDIMNNTVIHNTNSQEDNEKQQKDQQNTQELQQKPQNQIEQGQTQQQKPVEDQLPHDTDSNKTQQNNQETQEKKGEQQNKISQTSNVEQQNQTGPVPNAVDIHVNQQTEVPLDKDIAFISDTEPEDIANKISGVFTFKNSDNKHMRVTMNTADKGNKKFAIEREEDTDEKSTEYNKESLLEQFKDFNRLDNTELKQTNEQTRTLQEESLQQEVSKEVEELSKNQADLSEYISQLDKIMQQKKTNSSKIAGLENIQSQNLGNNKNEFDIIKDNEKPISSIIKEKAEKVNLEYMALAKLTDNNNTNEDKAVVSLFECGQETERDKYITVTSLELSNGVELKIRSLTQSQKDKIQEATKGKDKSKSVIIIGKDNNNIEIINKDDKDYKKKIDEANKENYILNMENIINGFFISAIGRDMDGKEREEKIINYKTTDLEDIYNENQNTTDEKYTCFDVFDLPEISSKVYSLTNNQEHEHEQNNKNNFVQQHLAQQQQQNQISSEGRINC